MRIHTESLSTSRLDEARAEIRSHTDLEAIIRMRIAELPIDNSCYFSREAFQYGAGYGYTCVDGTAGPDAFVIDESEAVRIHPDVIEAFFYTRPRNKYRGFDELRRYREVIEKLVVQVSFGEPLECPDSIDRYELAAFISFIDGYQLVTNSVTHNQH